MANESDDGKAAKVKADAEKAAAKAKAEATKAEAGTAAAAASTPAAKKRAAKNEVQVHVVTREVMHDSDVYLNGDDIELTRAQHAQLHEVGAVAEAWRD